ncbi:MAG: hypothetical protein ACQEQI_06755, partial [Bacillota bacterium]
MPKLVTKYKEVILAVLLLMVFFISSVVVLNWANLMEEGRVRLETLLEERMGYQVQIKELDVIGINQLRLSGVEVSTSTERLVTLEELVVKSNLWQLILSNKEV